MPRPPNPQVRSRLLEKGMEIIQSQGFNGCGIQDITSAAGVPKGSFYNYFESKDAFAVAILEEYWSVIDSNFVGILFDDTLAPVERVQRHFSGLIEYHEGQDFNFGCLIGNLALELSSQSAVARSKLKSLVRKWAAALAACLVLAQKRRALRKNHDPHELALALIEAFEGAVMVSKVERNRDALHRFETVSMPMLLA